MYIDREYSDRSTCIYLNIYICISPVEQGAKRKKSAPVESATRNGCPLGQSIMDRLAIGGADHLGGDRFPVRMLSWGTGRRRLGSTPTLSDQLPVRVCFCALYI